MSWTKQQMKEIVEVEKRGWVLTYSRFGKHFSDKKRIYRLNHRNNCIQEKQQLLMRSLLFQEIPEAVFLQAINIFYLRKLQIQVFPFVLYDFASC